MGRCAVLKLSDLFALPNHRLYYLPKERVLDICTGDNLNFQDRISSFGFLTRSFLQRLSRDDVNFVFSHFYPALHRSLKDESLFDPDIINLITLCLRRVAVHVGPPIMQLQYKDLYLAVLPIISGSLDQAIREQESDVVGTLRLHRVLLGFLMSRPFRLRWSLEMLLFRKVIVHLVHICGQLLHFDRPILTETWHIVITLIDENEKDISGSKYQIVDLSGLFQYLSKFLNESQHKVCPMAYSALQLHFTGFLKLRMYDFTKTHLLRIRAHGLIAACEEFDQQPKSNNEEREKWFSHLKGIIQRLLQMSTLEDMTLMPNQVSFKYCFLMLDQFLVHPNHHVLDLFRFITESLLTPDKLASTTGELRRLMARSTTVVHSLIDNSELFHAVMRLLVQVTISPTSPTCRAFIFSNTVQENVIRLLPQKSLISAFFFYKAVLERLPNNPTTPVRWTIFGLTRTIFSLMFSKAQRQVRDQLSEHELILFSAINRDHTSKLSERVIGLTKRFPQNIAVFKKMCTTMQILAMSNHRPHPDQVRVLNRHLHPFWTFIMKRIRRWGRFHWMGVFVHLLIRVTAKVNQNLLKIHLTPVACAKLPQFTGLQIILALLDCGRRGDTISQLTELFVRKCNVHVKNYIFYLHSLNQKNCVLERMIDDHEDNQRGRCNSKTPIATHYCCERTCCFVLANQSEAEEAKHDTIACNINHAIDELQKRRCTIGVPREELMKICSLASQLNAILSQMPQ